MAKKIYVTTTADEIVVGKIPTKHGEEYLVVRKGQVVELTEDQITPTVQIYLANGNLREVEPPKKKEKKHGNDGPRS